MCFIVGDNIFTGDTLFYLCYGRTDLAGGDDNKMEKSLEKLTSIPFSIAYPGHGIPFKKEDNKNINK